MEIYRDKLPVQTNTAVTATFYRFTEWLIIIDRKIPQIVEFDDFKCLFCMTIYVEKIPKKIAIYRGCTGPVTGSHYQIRYDES